MDGWSCLDKVTSERAAVMHLGATELIWVAGQWRGRRACSGRRGHGVGSCCQEYRKLRLPSSLLCQMEGRGRNITEAGCSLGAKSAGGGRDPSQEDPHAYRRPPSLNSQHHASRCFVASPPLTTSRQYVLTSFYHTVHFLSPTRRSSCLSLGTCMTES